MELTAPTVLMAPAVPILLKALAVAMVVTAALVAAAKVRLKRCGDGLSSRFSSFSSRQAWRALFVGNFPSPRQMGVGEFPRFPF